MFRRTLETVCAVIFVLAANAILGRSVEQAVEISARPLHEGRISPMLCGNFIELLDDLVPGMRAEMLNDRGFEGVTRPNSGVYFDGRPGLCDREWETDQTWAIEEQNAFNGPRCARLSSRQATRARLSQSGLAVRKSQ